MAKKPTTDAGADTAGSTDVATLSPDQQAAQALSYEATKTRLAELAKESTSLVRVDTDDSFAAARSAKSKLQTTRVSIEKIAKEARDGANKFQKAVIAKERELIDVIRPEEQRLDRLISDEAERRAAVERAAKEAEARRAAAITAAFARVRALPTLADSLDVAGIDALIVEAEKLREDPSHLPEDMHAAARYEASVAINACKAARDRRIKADQDAAELEELRRERAARAQVAAPTADEAQAYVASAQKLDAQEPAGAVTPVRIVEDSYLSSGRLSAHGAPMPVKTAAAPPTLLKAAKAALSLMKARGLGGEPAALDLAEAIDEADIPGGRHG